MNLARVCALVMMGTALSAAAPQASGVIAGTLVAADTGAPVRDARVALKSETLSESILTTSDDQGAFAFTGLAAGRYELSAYRTGFVLVKFGEKRPGFGGQGRSITLTDRQRIERLTLSMPRAGVLTGVILDEFGEPAMGAHVVVRRYVTMSGRRVLMGAGIGETDDRGVYRIFPLPPGDYIIAVSPPSFAARSEAFQLGAMSAMGSRTSSTTDPPSARTSATGAFITSVLRPEAEGSPRPGYVTMFYPGGTALSLAETIRLGAGEVRSGLDIRLQRVQLSRVSGTVRDLDGSIPAAEVQLRPLSTTAAAESAEGVTSTKHVGLDGGFSFTGVAPGQYTLAARARPGEAGSPEMHWALQDVTVGGANIDGVSLTLQSGLTVSGTIAADSGALPEISGHVNFAPVEDTRFLAGPSWLKWAAISAGGRFTASSLVPGRYVVSLSQDVPGWNLASATFGGRDALDFLLEVKAGENPIGLITLSSRETELSGRLLDSNNVPTNTYTVVVFAADERYWLPDNRRNQTATPDGQGRFAFKNLPPGNYRLAAVEDFNGTAGIDIALLRDLAAAPTISVTIAAGDRKIQDLRIK